MADAFCPRAERLDGQGVLDHDPRLARRIVVPAAERREGGRGDRALRRGPALCPGPGAGMGTCHSASACIGRSMRQRNATGCRSASMPAAITTIRRPRSAGEFLSHEDYVAQAQAFQSQLTSLICEGVFNRHPELKIVMLESGWTWLPSHLWRLTNTGAACAWKSPWVDRRAADIVRSNIRLSLQPTDAPPDAALARVLEPSAVRRASALLDRLSALAILRDGRHPGGMPADLVRKIKSTTRGRPMPGLRSPCDER